jgi:uncharacterized DUF497 family protein
MHIVYDPEKSERNRRERGLPFDRAAAFDFQNALYAIDERRDYGETRFVALGLIGDRVHVLCFVETDDGIRVISLRKANPREVNRYVQNQTSD